MDYRDLLIRYIADQEVVGPPSHSLLGPAHVAALAALMPEVDAIVDEARRAGMAAWEAAREAKRREVAAEAGSASRARREQRRLDRLELESLELSPVVMASLHAARLESVRSIRRHSLPQLEALIGHMGAAMVVEALRRHGASLAPSA